LGIFLDKTRQLPSDDFQSTSASIASPTAGRMVTMARKVGRVFRVLTDLGSSTFASPVRRSYKRDARTSLFRSYQFLAFVLPFFNKKQDSNDQETLKAVDLVSQNHLHFPAKVFLRIADESPYRKPYSRSGSSRRCQRDGRNPSFRIHGVGLRWYRASQTPAEHPNWPSLAMAHSLQLRMVLQLPKNLALQSSHPMVVEQS
jgi:hypothetical protein